MLKLEADRKSQSFSLYKDVKLIEFLNIPFDFGHFLFASLLLLLEAYGVDLADVRDALVCFINLLPFLLESLPEFDDLLLAETVLILGDVVLEVLDHLILVLDIVLDVLEVHGDFSIVLLL